MKLWPSSPVKNALLGITLIILGGSYMVVWLTSDHKFKKKKKEILQEYNTIENAEKAEYPELISIHKDYLPIVTGHKNDRLEFVEEKVGCKIQIKRNTDEQYNLIVTGKQENINRFRKLILDEIELLKICKEELIVPKILANKIDAYDIHLHTLAKVTIEAFSEDATLSKITIAGKANQLKFAKKKLNEEIAANIDSVGSLGCHFEYRKVPPTDAELCPKEERIPSPLGEAFFLLPKTIMLKQMESNSMLNNKGLIKVHISAIANPTKFWLQLNGIQRKRLNELVIEMTNYYADPANCSRHILEKFYVGQSVVAYFSGLQKWCRAEITCIKYNAVGTNAELIDVFFVDYGHSDSVNPAKVYDLRVDFLALRNQALECFLANIKPFNCSANDRPLFNWSDEVKHEFECFAGDIDKVHYARIVSYGGQSEREIPGIALYHEVDSEDFAIQLVKKGLAAELPAAVPSKAPSSITRNEKKNDWNDSDNESYSSDDGEDGFVAKFTKEMLLCEVKNIVEGRADSSYDEPLHFESDSDLNSA